jgi:DNA-nicking Smr family endonuclease
MKEFITSKFDEDLWNSTKEHYTPLKNKKDYIHKTNPTKVIKVNHKTPVVKHTQTTVANFTYQDMKKIRRNKVFVEKTLDLHGYYEKEAFEVFKNFIASSYNNNMKLVLVVTGKGKTSNTSTYGGVLKNAFLKWVISNECTPYIVSYNESLPCDGGSGAYYIYLRTKK